MPFFHLILVVCTAASTAFFGTKYLNENYPTIDDAPEENMISTSASPTTIPSPTTYNQQPTTTPTPSPTPTATPTSKPTPKPTLKPTITPIPTVTPTNTPAPTPVRAPTGVPATPTPSPSPVPTINLEPTTTNSNLYNLTTTYASQYNVDPNVLRFIIQCESGFNPAALSPNGLYAGLFQFSTGTWTSYRNLLGKNTDPALRFNAEEAIQTGAFAYSRTNGSIWPNCLP